MNSFDAVEVSRPPMPTIKNVVTYRIHINSKRYITAENGLCLTILILPLTNLDCAHYPGRAGLRRRDRVTEHNRLMKLCVSLFIDYVDPLLWQERMRRLVLDPAVGRNTIITNLLRMI